MVPGLFWCFGDCFVCPLVRRPPTCANQRANPCALSPEWLLLCLCYSSAAPGGPDSEDGDDVVRPRHCDDRPLPPHRNAALTGRAVPRSCRRASRVRWQASPAWAIVSSAGSPASWSCTSQDPCATTRKAWWKRTRCAWAVACGPWVRKRKESLRHAQSSS